MEQRTIWGLVPQPRGRAAFGLGRQPICRLRARVWEFRRWASARARAGSAQRRPTMTGSVPGSRRSTVQVFFPNVSTDLTWNVVTAVIPLLAVATPTLREGSAGWAEMLARFRTLRRPFVRPDIGLAFLWA